MATQTAGTDRFVNVNGLRLHYLEWGTAASPAIILLHGLRGSAHTWDLVAEPLSDRFHLLALDQRGRGESDWAPDTTYTRDTYVADVEQLAAQLGLARFVLIGHSMGGANALAYAAGHPDQIKAAVIEDMGPSTSPPQPGTARIGRELDAAPASFRSWSEAEAYTRELRPGTSEEGIRTAVQNSFKQNADGTVTWKYDLAGIRSARRLASGQPPADLWPFVRGLRCPTLVLHGEKSDILAAETARAMCDANPLIRWADIAGARHFVHDDNIADYNRELQRFLAEVAAA
jgi:esterase